VLFTVISLFYSCGIEEPVENIYKGISTFYKNGSYTTFDCVFNNSLKHDGYFLSVKNFNEQGYERESIAFGRLEDVLVGVKYDSIDVYYYTVLYDGDVLQSSYKLDTSANNFFVIDKCNEETGDVSGRFQLTMFLNKWYDWETQPEYDTIQFTEGQFETRINFLD